MAAPETTEENGGIVIARIVKARGLKGEVACNLETDFPERFAGMERVQIRQSNGNLLDLKLEGHWFHQGRVILKFEGYDSMTAAESLVGGLIVIPEQDPALLDEDEFYEAGIVGFEVITVTGAAVGKVARVMRTGGTDLLVVDGDDGREHLIPFADDICPEVDVNARRIRIDPPAGLLDL